MSENPFGKLRTMPRIPPSIPDNLQLLLDKAKGAPTEARAAVVRALFYLIGEITAPTEVRSQDNLSDHLRTLLFEKGIMQDGDELFKDKPSRKATEKAIEGFLFEQNPNIKMKIGSDTDYDRGGMIIVLTHLLFSGRNSFKINNEDLGALLKKAASDISQAQSSIEPMSEDVVHSAMQKLFGAGILAPSVDDPDIITFSTVGNFRAMQPLQNLTSRVSNALSRNGIYCEQALQVLSNEDRLFFRDLGNKGINELETVYGSAPLQSKTTLLAKMSSILPTPSFYKF